MVPTYVKRDGFTVAGVQVRCIPATANYPDIWMNQYMPFDEQLKPFSVDAGYYGVSFSTETPDEVEYLAGIAVTPQAQLPEGVVMREIPAARYAVFACTLATMSNTFQQIYQEWLPASGVTVLNPGFDFEYYPPGGTSPDAAVFIYVPLAATHE